MDSRRHPVAPDEPGGSAPAAGSPRAGDLRALEALVRRHGGRLLASCRRLLRDEARARDVVERTFARAVRRPDGLAGADLGTWLHDTALGLCLDALGSDAGGSVEPWLPQFLDDGHHVRHPEPWSEAGRGVTRPDLCALVRDTIDSVALPERFAVLLIDVEGLDVARGAGVLGVGEAELRRWLKRGRQALRTLLVARLARGTA